MGYWLTGAAIVALVLLAPILGYLEQPWASVWIGERPQAIESTVLGQPAPLETPVIGAGMVTDVQRYLLALGAGWSAADAITATAISIAEDGSGNPTALSAANYDGSRDFGLWQINSAHWSTYGGQAALGNPVANALAAHDIFLRQGWCAWSTYEARCGPGHTSAYAAFLGRAQAAATQQSIAIVTPPQALPIPTVVPHPVRGVRGYLIDYPDIPNWRTLVTKEGTSAIAMGSHCPISEISPDDVNVFASYSQDDPAVVGESGWLLQINHTHISGDPECEMTVMQWISATPCKQIDGLCDVAAITP